MIESLTLIVSGCCDFPCEHCAIEAASESERFLNGNILPNILDGMTRLGLDHISLAGGEGFSHEERCIRLCETFRDAGIRVTLGSSASWASDDRLAEEVAARLAAAGVSLLRISVDQRGRPAVPVEFVKRAALAVARRGVRYEIHIRSLDATHALRCIETLKSLDVRSALVKTSLDPKETSRRAWAEALKPASAASGCSMVDHPAVLWDGTVVACSAALAVPCLRPAEGSPLVLGHADEEDFIGILRDAVRSPVLALLRTYGPGRIWETMLARGGIARVRPAERRLEDSRCLLCHALFGDAGSAEASLNILFGEASPGI